MRTPEAAGINNEAHVLHEWTELAGMQGEDPPPGIGRCLEPGVSGDRSRASAPGGRAPPHPPPPPRPAQLPLTCLKLYRPLAEQSNKEDFEQRQKAQSRASTGTQPQQLHCLCNFQNNLAVSSPKGHSLVLNVTLSRELPLSGKHRLRKSLKGASPAQVPKVWSLNPGGGEGKPCPRRLPVHLYLKSLEGPVKPVQGLTFLLQATDVPSGVPSALAQETLGY